MNADGHTKFKSHDSSSDQADIIDLTIESDEESADDGPRKRVKGEAPRPAEAVVPKWSNPEYFTALPPPESLGAPKKDIVKVIRKAKVESISQTDASSNAVKENIDFISFNDDVDEGELSESDSEDDIRPPSNAPTEPSGLGQRNHVQPIGNREPNGQAMPYKAPPTTFKPINLRSTKDTTGPPPPPPPDLVMPTEEELVEQCGAKNAGKKRKRDDISKELGAIVPEWRGAGPDSTPWCNFDYESMAHTGLQ